MRRKQDKEREAAGFPPVQRLGARGAAPQRGGQRGGLSTRGGQSGSAPPRAAPRGSTGRTVRMVADKNLYVHLLGHLRKKNLLPVVVFTFSKKRCEENATTLTNADLCTSVEKSEVHVAVEKALSRLKGIVTFNGLHRSLTSTQVLTRNCPKSVACVISFPVELAFIMVDFYLSSRR